MIVEPVQGVAARSTWAPTSSCAALRTRCDAAGALLIFDEVQCGIGRTGQPFAANYYGVTPDMITTAKALERLPVRRLADDAADHSRLAQADDLGTTFGGGPLACAAMEAVIDAIEQEDLLANVRARRPLPRATCAVGPVAASRARDSLLACARAAPPKDVQRRAARARHPRGHQRGSERPAPAAA